MSKRPVAFPVGLALGCGWRGSLTRIEGLETWYRWLRGQKRNVAAACSSAPSLLRSYQLGGSSARYVQGRQIVPINTQ
jgi:hypothetical protein